MYKPAISIQWARQGGSSSKYQFDTAAFHRLFSDWFGQTRASTFATHSIIFKPTSGRDAWPFQTHLASFGRFTLVRDRFASIHLTCSSTTNLTMLFIGKSHGVSLPHRKLANANDFAPSTLSSRPSIRRLPRKGSLQRRWKDGRQRCRRRGRWCRRINILFSIGRKRRIGRAFEVSRLWTF